MPITLETPHALIELLLPLPGIAKNTIICIVGNAIILELRLRLVKPTLLKREHGSGWHMLN